LLTKTSSRFSQQSLANNVEVIVQDKTDVLIVGAGPTGLTLAAVLQQAGIDHLLIDALGGPQSTSRAAVIHPHTLEMLETIGVTAELSDCAVATDRFTVRDRDRSLLSISFAELPSPFQHMLLVPQSTTEAVIEARLLELGGRVHRSSNACRITHGATKAAVQVRTPEGERTVQARFVVGADGMHSVVRDAAKIAFDGARYSESFVLADVWMDWPLASQEVSLFFSPAGLVVVAPLPDGSYRIVATMENAPERPSIADIQAILDARGPATVPARIGSLIWTSRFCVHHRLAETYRKGPLLLMGDAAHVHSPAGGQGMNTGIVDAVVLGEALIRVLRDGVPDTLLDDYAGIRRPAAQAVLALASRLTGIATLHSLPARRMRNIVLRLLDRMRPFKHRLELALSGIARRRFSVLPPSGEAKAVASSPSQSAPSTLHPTTVR
jgi:2-polyprenyl-6-methoxyphenol hydroxylase-like FAD-dependent oxidoreductase